MGDITDNGFSQASATESSVALPPATGSAAMPEYRIYAMSKDNRIAGPATEIICDSDDEAITAAKVSMDGLDLEIWQGGRVVIRLKPTDNK
jgi:hypothetical protein